MSGIYTKQGDPIKVFDPTKPQTAEKLDAGSINKILDNASMDRGTLDDYSKALAIMPTIKVIEQLYAGAYDLSSLLLKAALSELNERGYHADIKKHLGPITQLINQPDSDYPRLVNLAQITIADVLSKFDPTNSIDLVAYGQALTVRRELNERASACGKTVNLRIFVTYDDFMTHQEKSDSGAENEEIFEFICQKALWDRVKLDLRLDWLLAECEKYFD